MLERIRNLFHRKSGALSDQAKLQSEYDEFRKKLEDGYHVKGIRVRVEGRSDSQTYVYRGRRRFVNLEKGDMTKYRGKEDFMRKFKGEDIEEWEKTHKS